MGCVRVKFQLKKSSDDGFKSSESMFVRFQLFEPNLVRFPFFFSQLDIFHDSLIRGGGIKNSKQNSKKIRYLILAPSKC